MGRYNYTNAGGVGNHSYESAIIDNKNDTKTIFSRDNYSAQANVLNLADPYDVIMVSMLDHSPDKNGVYSNSLVTFSFKDEGPGEYFIEPPSSVGTTTLKAAHAMQVDIHVGLLDNSNRGTVYKATSGHVKVTKDNKGKYYVNTVGSLPTTKFMDMPGGGVSGAPAAMEFTLRSF
jgi:hypothetical protein